MSDFDQRTAKRLSHRRRCLRTSAYRPGTPVPGDLRRNSFRRVRFQYTV